MKYFLFLLTLLCACNARSTAVSRAEFECVLLGTSVSEMTACIGQPYAIHCICPSVEEYEYIERFSQDNMLAYENHYFFKVVNGQVVSKRMCREDRPAYDLLYQGDPNYPSYPNYPSSP